MINQSGQECTLFIKDTAHIVAQITRYDGKVVAHAKQQTLSKNGIS